MMGTIPVPSDGTCTRPNNGREEVKMVGSLLTFFLVGLVTLVVAGLVLAVVGTVFSLTLGLAAFLLFKVAPILLVGWIAVKVFEKVRGRDEISEADRKWLEGG
jgi:archaellum biogenesis protein FlaJ (TadC family)